MDMNEKTFQTRKPRINEGRTTELKPGQEYNLQLMPVRFRRPLNCREEMEVPRTTGYVHLNARDHCRQDPYRYHERHMELVTGERGGVYLKDPVTGRQARIPWMHEWSEGRWKGTVRTPLTLKVVPKAEVTKELRTVRKARPPSPPPQAPTQEGSKVYTMKDLEENRIPEPAPRPVVPPPAMPLPPSLKRKEREEVAQMREEELQRRFISRTRAELSELHLKDVVEKKRKPNEIKDVNRLFLETWQPIGLPPPQSFEQVLKETDETLLPDLTSEQAQYVDEMMAKEEEEQIFGDLEPLTPGIAAQVNETVDIMDERGPSENSHIIQPEPEKPTSFFRQLFNF